MSGNPNIVVEVTDASEFHCFRLIINPREARYCETHRSGECDGTGPACVIRSTTAARIEVMFHARSLVDLIHKCSLALCDWQAQTSADLLRRLGFPAAGGGQ